MQSILQPTQLTTVARPAQLRSVLGAAGDILGPGPAVDGEVALYAGVTGRRLRRGPVAGAVGLSLLALSTLTAGSLLLGNGAGAPTELATTAYGRSLLGLADASAGRSALSVPSVDEVAAGYQPLDADLTAIAALTTQAYGRSLLTAADAAAGRSALGLGSLAVLSSITASQISDSTTTGRSLLTAADVAAARGALGLGVAHSPTFNGLTSTDTVWATNGTVQAILSFGASTGNIGTNSAHALALITGGSQRVNIGTDGVTTFYGAAPGTPGAGEARIGGGLGRFYGAVHAGNPSAIDGTDNGLVVGGDIEIARDGVGGTQRHGRIRSVPGAIYAGGIAFDRYYYNGSSYVFGEVLRLDDAGSATFSGNVFMSSASPYQYLDRSASGSSSGVVFRDSSASPTRKSWFVGVQNNVDDGWELTPSTTDGGTTFSTPVLRIPSTGLATFYSATPPGTPGSNQVLIGAGQVACPSGQGLYIGGAARFTGDASYSHVRSPSGAVKMYAANSATYYDNDAHVFRDAAGSAGGTIYIGDSSTDGSWRFVKSGANLVIQARDAGSWVDVQTFYFPV